MIPPFLSDNYRKDPKIRELLYDFGYAIETCEMKREFYLKNRVSSVERKNLLEIFEILKYSAIKDKLAFRFAILGIGTSTYSEQYFSDLEKYLKRNGFHKDGIIFEKAEHYGDQFIDFKNYNCYLDFCNKHNSNSPFDEQINPVSKKIFIEVREKEQIPYFVPKKVKNILTKKGEDLDFIVCADSSSYLTIPLEDYHKDKMEEFKRNFEKNLISKEFKFKKESSHLANSCYHLENKKVVRRKDIEIAHKTYRIMPKKGRSLHFYVLFELADLKIIQERIHNRPFVQLIRKGNFEDFRDTILHGEKTGVFENPLFVQK